MKNRLHAPSYCLYSAPTIFGHSEMRRRPIHGWIRLPPLARERSPRAGRNADFQRAACADSRARCSKRADTMLDGSGFIKQNAY
ncbi:hypothetical protein FKO59_03635 [Burkholderia pseudomallei]|nr:hypothetical protein [Burkholderia pseudomallei]OSP94180.1 hypothetical protein BOC41_16795 [Burkholderia pseudomallei]QDH26791.1 hypothetical protein FKO42_03640 [Burkholderia pseudomallei]QDH37058.1 hypothetical protein FKO59_03635 [Burkholderia pseudomallei]RIV70216.1 hypothetical protein D2W72_15235 [Burkholderia pseudomallei]